MNKDVFVCLKLVIKDFERELIILVLELIKYEHGQLKYMFVFSVTVALFIYIIALHI